MTKSKPLSKKEKKIEKIKFIYSCYNINEYTTFGRSRYINITECSIFSNNEEEAYKKIKKIIKRDCYDLLKIESL